jgi:hypothetical protein
MQVLNPKAIQKYAAVLDYEAHTLVQSIYSETRKGTIPIDPARLVGRFTLKYVTNVLFLHGCGSLNKYPLLIVTC